MRCNMVAKRDARTAKDGKQAACETVKPVELNGKGSVEIREICVSATNSYRDCMRSNGQLAQHHLSLHVCTPCVVYMRAWMCFEKKNLFIIVICLSKSSAENGAWLSYSRLCLSVFKWKIVFSGLLYAHINVACEYAAISVSLQNGKKNSVGQYGHS